MAELAKKKATYEDLYDIPENMIGEIIDGELIDTEDDAGETQVAELHGEAQTVCNTSMLADDRQVCFAEGVVTDQFILSAGKSQQVFPLGD